MNSITNKTGYAALITVITLGAVIVIIGISTSLSAINHLQVSLAGEKSQEAYALSEACAEEALLRYNKTGVIPSTVSLPEGNCDAMITTQSLTSADFTIDATLAGYTRKIRIEAARSNTITILSWNEVD